MEPHSNLTPEQRQHFRAMAAVARERARERLAAAVVRRQNTADKLATSEVSLDRSERTLMAMRASIAEYASILHQLDTPPKQAIIEVKAIVYEACGSQGHAAEAIAGDAVAWAIHAYYVA